MKNTNIKNKNTGITLIALIITIIVMLILVAVTINMAVNGGLFSHAGKATGETKNALNEEKDLGGGKITIDGKIYNSIDEYIKGDRKDVPISGNHDWNRNGDTLTCMCTACKKQDSNGRVLTIGQELNYVTNEGANSTVITAEKSGYTEDQTITKDADTKWAVLAVEDKDNNGTNETLLLTTKKPTTDTITVVGAVGYNNFVEEINRMCVELYGTQARGMTIKDVDNCFEFTPSGGLYYIEYGVRRSTGNFNTKLKDLSTWESIKNFGTFTPEGTNSADALGEYIVNGYGYQLSSDGNQIEEWGNSENTKAISEACKELIFTSSDERNAYGLASRVVIGGRYRCSCWSC